ncbi:MoxR family ATPase [candidate division TA06 bacterium]|nr:MoxR family ATPase [candidate division TA06 bacterium]
MTMKKKSDIEIVEELKDAHKRILQEIEKVIVGQKKIVEGLLTCLLANGHCLIIGVPGLAKTLLVTTLARVLSLSSNRIQFTPDLMPSDITGTDVIEEDRATGKRSFRFMKGPLFANIILADEINRTPPKTQSALLQSMQEYKITAGGNTYPLDLPFFVFATQNPIEQEGTYPLPEAQLDRFMFNLYIDYPSPKEEEEIVKTTTSAYEADLNEVLTGEEILELQKLVRRVPVSDQVLQYSVRLVGMTRPKQDGVPKYINDWVSWGAGPRASQYLILGAKTKAALDGRYTPSIDDVQEVAMIVLRHRIVTNFNAEADGVGTDVIIQKILDEVKK